MNDFYKYQRTVVLSYVYTSVSQCVLEMEDMYATGGNLFKHLPFVELHKCACQGTVTVGHSGCCCAQPV